MAQLDCFGRSNWERAKEGLAPFTNGKEKVELHFMGQNPNNPCMELTAEQHRGERNFGILHREETPAGIDRRKLRLFRANYWKGRAK